jgi:hypothetical protein
MHECRYCEYQIKQDEDGNWFDPDANDPWDYVCIQQDGDHEPKIDKR